MGFKIGVVEDSAEDTPKKRFTSFLASKVLRRSIYYILFIKWLLGLLVGFDFQN
ncbi:Hypothetical protein P9303_27281 [Prochlorococcus marinus str. MIT 9303]|uniref:Uncharacterized protein n=1 Tax=Prochlorococcus marinus (strain MIT 9303) TaxID=59922 RepID=A2CD98_PROM3|nr:Hypothetical protein P9303_27281 [Prochlorococcus marinus str. MIT 9303]